MSAPSAVRRPVPSSLKRFLDDDAGATAIEYGLIVGLIFLAIVGAIRSYTDNAAGMYDMIESNLVQ